MMNLSEEARQKVKEIVDERIKELFESGKLQIFLCEKSYAYSNSISKNIQVWMDGNKLYETNSKQSFSGL